MSRVPIGTDSAAAGTDEDWQEAWVRDFELWCAEMGDDAINRIFSEFNEAPDDSF
jgi:hypothetical protein